MNKCILHTISLIIFLSLLINSVLGQTISKEAIQKFNNWPRYNEILRFYQLNDNRFVWLNNSAAQNSFLDVLKAADHYALNVNDYLTSFFQSYTSTALSHNPIDSLETELRFTDAAIHFFNDIKNGNKPPAFGYAGLKYVPDVNSVIIELNRHLAGNDWDNLIEQLQPKTREYNNALLLLRHLQHIVAEKNFKEEKIITLRVDTLNKALVKRLHQLGFLNNINEQVSIKDLIKSIKNAQEMFNIPADGLLRKNSLPVFNISLEKRIKELKTSINYLRWLEQAKQNDFVLLLNIPSANLYVYDGGKIVLDSKVIVGKTSTHTPTVTGTITEVILYPYWMVPNKIARNELLPAIKRNVDYIEANNYQVLSKNGIILNPYIINWHALSSSYFPYIIRQSTGCDNSLGIVKFNFDNPFTVYLHDTPNKTLFNYSSRFYSHGCMRVEKPIELAHLVLGNNRIAIDTLTAKGCINHQRPLEVAVQRKLPVIILYSTVWYNKEGAIRFYGDIYNKLN